MTWVETEERKVAMEVAGGWGWVRESKKMVAAVMMTFQGKNRRRRGVAGVVRLWWGVTAAGSRGTLEAGMYSCKIIY